MYSDSNNKEFLKFKKNIFDLKNFDHEKSLFKIIDQEVRN